MAGAAFVDRHTEVLGVPGGQGRRVLGAEEHAADPGHSLRHEGRFSQIARSSWRHPLDGGSAIRESLPVKSCGLSGSQDLAFVGTRSGPALRARQASGGRGEPARARLPANAGAPHRAAAARRRSVVVFGPRRLCLEEEHDLGPAVRNPLRRSLDGTVVRHPDAHVAAADPGAALRRLAEDVEPPATGRRLSYPRLMRARSFLRQRCREAGAHGEELKTVERVENVAEPGVRDGDSMSSCSRSPPPRKRSIAQPAATYHGGSTPSSRRATSSWPPGVPFVKVGVRTTGELRRRWAHCAAMTTGAHGSPSTSRTGRPLRSLSRTVSREPVTVTCA